MPNLPPNPLTDSIPLLQRVIDLLSRPLRVLQVRRVVGRLMMMVQFNSLSATPTVSQWFPVSQFTELLMTVNQQNANTGVIAGLSIQFQVMDELNGAPINFGTPLTPTITAGAQTIGVAYAQLNTFGAWIRASVVCTGTPTLNGNLNISFQGK